MRKLPPLTALPAFEATARLGSVTRAAQELNRTHGAISKQLRNLETPLGSALFEKAGNGLQLTEAGAYLVPRIAEALDQIADAAETIRHTSPGETLVLGISATFASRWLMPRLPRFAAQHPSVKIEFKMAGRQALTVSECDLIISWDRLRFAPTVTDGFEVLSDVAFGLVHAPGYRLQERAGQSVHVATRLLPDTNPKVWEVWGAQSGISVISDGTYEVPQTGLLIDAATAGMGAALLERRLIEDELADERLLAPFGFHIIPGGFGVFVSARGRAKPAARAFITWLRGEA